MKSHTSEMGTRAKLLDQTDCLIRQGFCVWRTDIQLSGPLVFVGSYEKDKMDRQQAYLLFEQIIVIGAQILRDFTLHSDLAHKQKADRSVVTACDKKIDEELSQVVRDAGLRVVSEEGEHYKEIVRSGDYVTIDPIDGTLGYIEYVNDALEKGTIYNFLAEDLGPLSDFCLLIGIVKNGVPRFGACYNYITKEKILIDGNDKNALIRENNIRNYSQQYAVYVDQRSGDELEAELTALPFVSVNKQAALGLKSIYTILNPHISAITVHRVQKAGLWDIVPAAVAARAFGGQVFDDTGEVLSLTDYAILPGNGATIIKGEKFGFILEKLRR